MKHSNIDFNWIKNSETSKHRMMDIVKSISSICIMKEKKPTGGSNKSIYCTELGFDYILLSFFGLTDTLVNGSQTHTQYP